MIHLRPLHSGSVLENANVRIAISLHEFNGLQQITKDQVMRVYEGTMRPGSLLRGYGSYYRICSALYSLGVMSYDVTRPDTLLAR